MAKKTTATEGGYHLWALINAVEKIPEAEARAAVYDFLIEALKSTKRRSV